jgi:Leucine-rich repeat (LRR) protein
LKILIAISYLLILIFFLLFDLVLQCTQLTAIDISCSYQLNEGVSDSCLSKLTNLKYLSLMENHTISSPGIKYLNNLTSLDLAACGLVDDSGI